VQCFALSIFMSLDEPAILTLFYASSSVFTVVPSVSQSANHGNGSASNGLILLVCLFDVGVLQHFG